MSVGDNPRQRREEFNRNSGYECDLVEEQPKFQWQCQICHCILREPHQVKCCGYSFCKVCIEQAQAKKRECPLCNEIIEAIFYDKGLERTLNELRVYCTHKDKGCEWEGELGELGKHLDSPDNKLAGCKFENTECIFCTKLFERNCLQSHQSECPMRPFSCQYCQYDSTYVDVTQNHWGVCASYPLQCPNCKQVVQRQQLEGHVNRDCPNTCIACDFNIVGCQVQLARNEMPSHIRENISGHMHQLQQHLATQPVANHVTYVPLLVGSMQKVVIDNIDTRSRLNEAEKSLRESQETIFHQKTELENLHKELEQSQQQMERQVLKLEETQQRIDDGERARNELEAKTTDTFTGKIGEVYKSMNEDRTKQAEDFGNIRKDVETAMKTQEQKQHKSEEKVQELAQKLIQQGAKRDRVEGELKSSLKEVKSSFKRDLGSSVKKIESTLAVQEQTLHRLSLSGTLPVTFTISNVKERVGRNEEVESPPFYTHPHGYRLCARIRLRKGNTREGYISVYFYLMQGMFDDELSWPFQGEIKFELVNQLRDMRHHQCTINFAECQDRQINDRVRGVRRSGGFGMPEFIAHSQLAVQQTQYLKDDQLQIRIVEVLNIQPVHITM